MSNQRIPGWRDTFASPPEPRAIQSMHRGPAEDSEVHGGELVNPFSDPALDVQVTHGHPHVDLLLCERLKAGLEPIIYSLFTSKCTTRSKSACPAAGSRKVAKSSQAIWIMGMIRVRLAMSHGSNCVNFWVIF